MGRPSPDGGVLDDCWPPGTLLEICGLVKATAFNGQHAEVLRYDGERGVGGAPWGVGVGP